MADASVALRELAQVAHERELQSIMDRLQDNFNAWQQGDVSVWQMETCLNDFVNGTSRALHTTYTLTDPSFSVAYAVSKGVLAMEEIPVELHKVFSHLLHTIKI